MAVAQKAVAYIELDEFLALENASTYRHEYLDGVIYAVQGDAVQGNTVRGMVGGSAAHADLIRNLGFALHTRLKGSPCRVMMSDMRLRINAADAVFYPDVLVHCQPTPNPASVVELTEATLVAEVLLPSTQLFDRGAKLQAYQKLPGLRHIVLVSATEPAAWACQRSADDSPWTPLQPWPANTDLALPGLNTQLAWQEVYGGVGL